MIYKNRMMKWLGKNVGKFICKIDFDISSSKKKQKKSDLLLLSVGHQNSKLSKIGHI